jgi:type II secretion system protein N
MLARRGASQSEARTGRSRGVWAGAAAALLVVLIAARFPYQRFLPPLLEAASAATGAQIEFGEVGLSLGWSGPRVVARNLRLQWPATAALSLAALHVRPAWSRAWLSGVPIWHVEASGDPGGWRGVVASDRVSGDWSAVDVDALPWVLFGSMAPLHGRVSGEVDLVRQNGAWQGSVKLRGEDGSVDLPGLPVAIPFEAFQADLAVAPSLVTLSSGRIQGPLVTASIAGTASAAGGAFATWPLALDVEIEELDPALRQYLTPLGISVDGRGRAKLRVTGSLASPYLGGLPR